MSHYCDNTYIYINMQLTIYIYISYIWGIELVHQFHRVNQVFLGNSLDR